MKKILLIVTFVVATALMICGCQNNTEPDATNPTQQNTQSSSPLEQPPTQENEQSPIDIVIEKQLIPIEYGNLGTSWGYDTLEEYYGDGDKTPSKQKQIDIHHIYQNKLYGAVVEMSGQSMLMKTDTIFIYDMTEQTTDIIQNPNDNRICDFAFIGGMLYYITAEYGEADRIDWKLFQSSTDFTNSTLLQQGVGGDVFDLPRFKIYDDKLYLGTLDGNATGVIDTVSVIDGETVELLFKLNGDFGGISNFNQVKFNDNKMYFVRFDETNNYLEQYDLQSGQTETVYTTKTTDAVVRNFAKADDFLLISQTVNSSWEVELLIVDEQQHKTIDVESDFIPYTDFPFFDQNTVAVVDGQLMILDNSGVVAKGSIDGENFDMVLGSFKIYDNDTLIVQEARGGIYFVEVS